MRNWIHLCAKERVAAVWIFNFSICVAWTYTFNLARSVKELYGRSVPGASGESGHLRRRRRRRRRPIRIGFSCTERQTASCLVWQRVSARQTRSICLTVSRYLSSNSHSHTHRERIRERKRESPSHGNTHVTKTNALLGLIAARTASGKIVTTKFYCQEVGLARRTRVYLYITHVVSLVWGKCDCYIAQRVTRRNNIHLKKKLSH